MRRQDLFRKIAEFPHNLGFFTTYTIDMEVVNKLKEHTTARTFILHDKKMGITEQPTYNGRLCLRPAKLVSNPQNPMSIFHAKIALLIGEKKVVEKNVAICIGSANLTRDSFEQEKETCVWIEVEREATELDKIINWIGNYLPPGWKSLSDELKASKTLNDVPENWCFLHNRDDSISKHIIEIVKEKWKLEISKSICHIASPFWPSNNQSAVDWINNISTREVYLYTRYNNSIIPLLEGLNNSMGVFVRFPSKGKKRDNFHSKQIMFEWENDREAVIFIGSANFTNKGFFLSEIAGGNAECGLLIRLKDKEYLEAKEWFDKGWEKAQSLIELTVDKLPSLPPDSYEQFEPYFWAELEENQQYIDLFAVVADKPIIKIIGPTEKGSIEPQLDYDTEWGVYKCKVPKGFLHKKVEEDDFLKIEMLDKKYEVPVFRKEDFDNAYCSDGCSIFGEYYSSQKKPPYSLKELKEYIKKSGIKSDQYTVEPPALEEFHRIWKKRFENMKSCFTKRHIQELQNELKKLGVEGLYVIFHLKKLLKGHSDSEIAKLLNEEESRLLLEYKRPGWNEFIQKIEAQYENN